MNVDASRARSMNRARVVGAALAIVLSLVAAWWGFERRAAPATAANVPAASREVESAVPSEPLATGEVGRASALPVPEPEPASPSEPAPGPTRAPSTRVHGTVVDLKGAPVAGVGIVSAGDPSARILAWSDGRGEFQCQLTSTDGVLVAGDGRHATVRGCAWMKSAASETGLIIVAAAISIEGRVVDEGHQGIGGAWLWLDLPADAFVAVGLPLDSTEHEIRLAASNAEGAFHFDSVPAVEGGFLRAESARYATARVPLPSSSATNVEVVMHAPPDSTPHLDGVVLFVDGRPAADATVNLGSQSTRSDASGEFRLELGWLKDTAPLSATKPGYQPAVVRGFGRVVVESNRSPPPARLVLGGPVLQIEGRVVRSDGGPCAGFHVSIVDGLEISQGLMPPVFAEHLSIGAEGGKSTTDGNGAFRLDGLAAREYRLQAWDPESLVLVESEAIAAGRKDALLTLPADARRELVRGRVLSTAGAPMSNVRVLACLLTTQTDHGSDWIEGRSTFTDGTGAFELRSVPRNRLLLRFTGSDIMPLDRAIPGDQPTDDLSITVLPRCHFRIEAGAGDSPAEALTALDSNGALAMLWSLSANQWSGTTYAKLASGRSDVLSAGEGSYTFVLHRAGKEIKRIPVSLSPGDVRVIEP